MAFPNQTDEADRRRLAILAFLILAAIVGIAAIFAVFVIRGGDDSASAQTVREYNLEIVGTDIDYGGGNVWHAWTFKDADADAGSVPGPTLHVEVGEKLVVNVENQLDLVHSFHTHFSNYDLAYDGSQLNTITGVGAKAMIPPGEVYTYEFEPTEPGIYYYHCHSADGGHHITEHVHQGLYGAIIVDDPDEAPKRDEVIFMSEIGFDTEGDDVPLYIMNGLGLPGGEHQLETVFMEDGIEAVQAQFNKTVPLIEAKTDEEMRVHVINIGDAIHSFHAHNVKHISLGTLRGEQWAANLLPLVPGQADTLSFTFTKPGLWLFHCHVVAHADAGMIGVFNITDPEPPPE
ncbi:MAG TPA: multicopper oxidase domain-containing protein [Dehalococcoidia bacterium]|nr:multicopper oxidase domain-containing protein [Dehalococcoidia bacterium]